MQIVLAVVVTFVLTVFWQRWADSKNHKSIQFLLRGILHDMDEMANKLGHENTMEYYKAKKGEEYAKVAQLNLQNTFDALK